MRASLLLLLIILPSCVDDRVDTASAAAAVADDPVQACPLPDPAAIAGHEAVFYECAEQSADYGNGCGPDGYLLGYGTRYARRFYRETRPQMSPRGRRWIDDVLVCLQRDLQASIDETTSCDDIRQIAFDSHPGCYVDAGFCSLSLADILHVVWTVDLRDWLSLDAARQLVRTAASCSREDAWAMALFFGGLLHDS